MNTNTKTFRMIVTLALLALSAPAFAEDWGDLHLKFKLDGVAPPPGKLVIDKDQAICGKHALFNETLTVGKDGQLPNLVVFISPKAGTKVPVHKDYEKTAKAEIVMDNSKCRFDPHIVVLRTTQKLKLGNKDAIGHNTKADFFSNTPFNDLIPAGGSIVKSLTKAETTPSPVSCSIHPWMSGKLLIREEPYAGVSDAEGVLKLAHVPAGKWTFTVWHESCGFVTKAKVGGKEVTWAKGKAEFEITKDGGKEPIEVMISVDTLIKKK